MKHRVGSHYVRRKVRIDASNEHDELFEVYANLDASTDFLFFFIINVSFTSDDDQLSRDIVTFNRCELIFNSSIRG